eukprot:gene18190-20004_t
MLNVTDTLRQRKSAVKVIKELDAFPKVPDSYKETSASGGTVSVLVFTFIGILMISEFAYYKGTELKYSFEVDRDAESKIRINVDMTVAMKCDDIGADVLDLSGTSIDTETDLKLEETYFRLGKNQENWRKFLYKYQSEGYRTINDVLDVHGVSGGKAFPTYLPPRDDAEFKGEQFDACRIHGKIEVNKVAGNFHVTAGKSIPHPRGHAHLSALVSEEAQNFSHRVDLLSFGEPVPGVINPLDGDIQITKSNQAMYQYYIQIVPTSIKTDQRGLDTHQFSVTQRKRNIDPHTGGRGVPGIFMKYDLNSLKVQVTEEGRPFWQFIVRLCGIIGGIFATSGMLHSFVGFLFEEAGKQFPAVAKFQEHMDQPRANGPAVIPEQPNGQIPSYADNKTIEPDGMESIRLIQPEDLPTEKSA